MQIESMWMRWARWIFQFHLLLRFAFTFQRKSSLNLLLLRRMESRLLLTFPKRPPMKKIWKFHKFNNRYRMVIPITTLCTIFSLSTIIFSIKANSRTYHVQITIFLFSINAVLVSELWIPIKSEEWSVRGIKEETERNVGKRARLESKIHK